MANRNLINALLADRWSANSAPAAGATLAASVSAPQEPEARLHLETLIYSIRNMMGAGALNTTITVSVRHATPAGTVIASFDHLTAPSTSTNVSMTRLGFAGKRGKGIHVTMDTVVASVKQSVSMAGWKEE